MEPLTRLGIALLLLLLAGMAAAGPTRIELIPLKHRTAEEVIPMLQPFVGPDGALSGTGYQLILKATPDNLEQIRTILKTLDTAPRRLRVVVRQDADIDRSGGGASAWGRVVIGRGGDVRGSAGANVYNTHIDEDAAATQQVMVQEGSSAYIQIGQSVPIVEHYIDRYGREVQSYDAVTYRDVTTGFYVLPRVRGDQVTLEINPHRESLHPQGANQIDLQEMHTTVSGRLGEWMDIGGVAEQQYRHGSGTVYSTRDARAERRRVFVKVEEVP